MGVGVNVRVGVAVRVGVEEGVGVKVLVAVGRGVDVRESVLVLVGEPTAALVAWGVFVAGTWEPGVEFPVAIVHPVAPRMTMNAMSLKK